MTNEWRRYTRDICLQVVARIIRTGKVIDTKAGAKGNPRAIFCEVDGDIVEKSLGEENTGLLARYFQHFGFRSRPPKDAEAVYASVRGSRAHRIVIATDNGGGTKVLEVGEAEIFAAGGQSIYLDKDGNVRVVPSSSGKVKLGTDSDASLDQVVTRQELNDKFSNIVNYLDNHVHAAGGYAAGATPVTGTSGPPNAFGPAPAVTGSPNVVAKKP